jgi:hypothetical protein
MEADHHHVSAGGIFVGTDQHRAGGSEGLGRARTPGEQHPRPRRHQRRRRLGGREHITFGRHTESSELGFHLGDGRERVVRDEHDSVTSGP